MQFNNLTNDDLVGGFNPSEKHESQLGSLFQKYGKIKFMFQTTNQVIYIYIYGKSQFPMGKSTINGPFSIAMLV